MKNGKRRKRLALQAIAGLTLQRVGARRRDRVVNHPHRLAELGRVAGGDDLDFANHDFGHRHLPQPGAILLGVVAAVDLIVDADERTVGGDARHAEFLVLEADTPGCSSAKL